MCNAAIFAPRQITATRQTSTCAPKIILAQPCVSNKSRACGMAGSELGSANNAHSSFPQATLSTKGRTTVQASTHAQSSSQHVMMPTNGAPHAVINQDADGGAVSSLVTLSIAWR